MKGYLKILILCFWSSLVIFTCTKSKIEIIDCEEIPDCGTFDGWYWETEASKAPALCLNPNNPDEVVFYEAYVSSDSGYYVSLTKYNFSTKEKQVLFTHNGPSHRVRWSKKDWLLFRLDIGGQFNIYKIKSNGDSLTQLTYSGNCHTPDWNITGDKFIYRLGFTFPTKFIIAGENGNILDTTSVGVTAMGTWQQDSLVANVNHKGLFIGNPYSDFYNYELVGKPLEESFQFGGAEWIDNEKVVWAHETGIYQTNTILKKTTRIIESCNAQFYLFSTYSPISDKLIFQRIDREVINQDACLGKQKVFLFIMNPDGSEMEEIVIPE